MSRFIPMEDSITYFRDKAGFLHLIKGINKKLTSAFESEGITTINQLLPLTESDLLKIKGVGKITAANVFIEIRNVINAMNS